MRISGIWAALTLACVILVAAAGACSVRADFTSLTSMFTAFPLPEHTRAQAPSLSSGEFLWNALNAASQSSGTTDSGLGSIVAIKNSFGSGTVSAPIMTSNQGWMNTMLKPGVNQSYNPGMASYDNFLKRYMSGSDNIFAY
jgi:hypothetical protein